MRLKNVLYVVGGGGAFLVFAVPLLWALFRSVQPNDGSSGPGPPISLTHASS